MECRLKSLASASAPGFCPSPGLCSHLRGEPPDGRSHRARARARASAGDASCTASLPKRLQRKASAGPGRSEEAGGRSSIEDSHEAGRWGPKNLGHQRLRSWSQPGEADWKRPWGFGRWMQQCAGASWGAMVTARGACACAWCCDPEVHPHAQRRLPRGALLGVSAAGPLLLQSLHKP